MKILLVEDDRETAEYIVTALASQGHDIDQTSDGREGLLLAGAGSYEVTIVDRMLPTLDGLTLVKHLREQRNPTAILFLTNLGGIDDRVEGLVHSARCLVASGEGQRVITSGGVTSYLDLGLFLAARFFGLEEAIRLARAYLIDWHSHGQLPFSSLVCSRQVEDRHIVAMQEWIADNYALPRLLPPWSR
jgi:CheY-like chemotaxis protein